MSSREDSGGQQRASRSAEDADEVTADPETGDAVRERVAKLGDDVDAILDEIDDVLEENAEEFVRGYVQKGGQ
jgi:ubiquitin-like protein Pup